MLALKPLFTVNRVTVFGDNADPDQFYYLPENVHLATDSAGKPAFTLIKYMRDITDNPTFSEGQQLGGGFLIFSVNLSLDDDTRSQILRQAGRFSNDSPRLATAPFTDGEVKVLALDSANPPGETRVRFVETVIGTTKPSLFGDLQATFSLELSQEGVTLLEKAFERGGQPIGLVYDLKFLGLRPAFDVTVKADYKRIYDEFNVKLAAQYMMIRAEIEAGFQKLIQNKAIEITVNSYTDDANMRQQQQDALKFFKDDLLKDFFTPSLSPPAAQSTSLLGELASTLGLPQPAARSLTNPGATPTAGPTTPAAQTAATPAAAPSTVASPVAASTSASAIRTAGTANPSQGVTTTAPRPVTPTTATPATPAATTSTATATPAPTASSTPTTPASSSATTSTTSTSSATTSSTTSTASPTTTTPTTATPPTTSTTTTASGTATTTPPTASGTTTPPRPATPATTPTGTPATGTTTPASGTAAHPTTPGATATPAAGTTTPAAGAQTPAARPNQAAPAQAGGNNLAIGFTMRYIHQDELKTFTMNWKEAAAAEQHHTPNGTFGLLLRGLNKSEHFISVNLDDDFFQRLKVMVDCPTPFASIGLSEVKLHLEYGDRGDGQPRYVDDVELKPDAQGHIQPQELTCSLDERHHLSYKYRLDFYFDPSTSIRGQKMHYTTEMITSLDRMLTIDPATFIGFLNVSATVGDLNFDEIPRVQVKIGYDDATNNFHVEDSFVLSKDKPTFDWRVRLSDPGQKTYWYDVTYFLVGDRNIKLPRQTGSGQNLVINEPWEDRMDVLVDALWDETLAHFVLQLDYEDTANNYRYSVVKRLAGQEEVPISLSIPVIDRKHRQYRYQTTALGKDNSVRRTAPVNGEETYLLMTTTPTPAPQP